MTKFPDEASRATAAQLLAVFMGSAAYMAGMGVMDPTTIPGMDQFVTWVTDPTILGALFWTGVVTTALTIYMETVALKTLSAAETTLIFSTEPLWGTAFASVVMGETLGMNAVFGAIMILSGCVVSNLDWKGLSLPSSISSLLPGQDYNSKQNKNTLLVDQMDLPVNPNDNSNDNVNMLPTGTIGKFSLKSGVAGALTGIVAAIGSASSSGLPPTIVPEELQDFIDNLPH